MLMSVLTDINKKKNKGSPNKKEPTPFRISNGLNGEIIPIIGSVLMNGDNPFILQVLPKNNQSHQVSNLQVEGVKNNITKAVKGTRDSFDTSVYL